MRMTSEEVKDFWRGWCERRSLGKDVVAAGEAIFTTLGFAGIYALLGLLFVVLAGRIILRGPEESADPAAGGHR